MDYLPIFVDLRDRLVVVVGGGVVAHRKIEHLLKAHARVRVVSPDLCADLALYRDHGRIEYRPLLFSPAQLEGATLVVAATDDVAVNDAVSVAARERGVLVNVVDDGPRCTFIFPAIVDRSPLIVAVGTAGSSPTLARRVRTQIEALLPARLGLLAEYAARWRESVKKALPDLPARLRFWDGFFSGPVAASVLAGNGAGADDHMKAALESARVAAGEARGEVYLIGVGPGDPDLLTLRAQQLLQQADVILHDRLVPDVHPGSRAPRCRAHQRGQDAGAARAHAGLHQPAAGGRGAQGQARGAGEGRRSVHLRPRRRGAGRAARRLEFPWSWCPASPPASAPQPARAFR